MELTGKHDRVKMGEKQEYPHPRETEIESIIWDYAGDQ